MEAIRPPLRGLRKGLRALNEAIAKVETAALVVVLTFMVGLAFANIVGRQFQHGIAWAEPVLKHAALYLAFLGASLATLEGRHISIDVMSRILPQAMAVVVQIIVNVAAIVVCVILTHAAVEYQGFVEMEGSPFWGLKAEQVTLIIPVGFALLTMRFGMRLVDLLLGLAIGEDVEVGHHIPAEVQHMEGAIGGAEPTGQEEDR